MLERPLLYDIYSGAGGTAMATALLLWAHALADKPLQYPHIFAAKIRAFKEVRGFCVLTLHAGVHALLSAAVLIFLEHPWVVPVCIIGLSHWAIDARRFWRGGVWAMVDQALHAGVILLLSWWWPGF